MRRDELAQSCWKHAIRRSSSWLQARLKPARQQLTSPRPGVLLASAHCLTAHDAHNGQVQSCWKCSNQVQQQLAASQEAASFLGWHRHLAWHRHKPGAAAFASIYSACRAERDKEAQAHRKVSERLAGVQYELIDALQAVQLDWV